MNQFGPDVMQFGPDVMPRRKVGQPGAGPSLKCTTKILTDRTLQGCVETLTLTRVARACHRNNARQRETKSKSSS